MEDNLNSSWECLHVQRITNLYKDFDWLLMYNYTYTLYIVYTISDLYEALGPIYTTQGKNLRRKIIKMNMFHNLDIRKTNAQPSKVFLPLYFSSIVSARTSCLTVSLLRPLQMLLHVR